MVTTQEKKIHIHMCLASGKSLSKSSGTILILSSTTDNKNIIRSQNEIVDPIAYIIVVDRIDVTPYIEN